MYAPIDAQALLCPGLAAPPCYLAELTDGDVKRLALAVIARALKDAQSRDKAHVFDRCSARTWLAVDGSVWLQQLGYRIAQADIDAFLAGDDRMTL